ncbi:MAG: NADH-quinone oxidoreductase subunit N [Verrucomicrobiota bacterium]|nr:NADH-quinone oxidoreductase subunit N [Verrucomicrobiota bacterium]
MPAYWLEATVVALGLLLLMMEAFGTSTSRELVRRVAIGGLILILAPFYFAVAPPADNAELARFYVYDNWAVFFKIIALITTILVLFMAYDYRKVLNRFTENPGSEHGTGEFYALPVFACAGMMWMASARDLVSIFVSLELVTITFYILVAFMRRQVGSLEAGVKYLILGALSTGFLVYGIAWIYGATGSTNLAEISSIISNPESDLSSNPAPLLFGLALILLALAFKVGAVPMHLWIPDVYQGAPTPITAFLSIGSKAAGFIVSLRILEPFFTSEITRHQTTLIVLVLASLTLVVGNLAAIPQSNFKRLLAYSSIAHAGFILLAIAAWHPGSEHSLSTPQVVSLYLATYLIITMGAFFVLVVVRNSEDSDEISAFEGLGQRNPFLAFCSTVLLSALAGLPLTAGFIGKLFAFQVAIDSASENKALWLGVGLGFIGVAASFYYYLKVVRSIYWKNPRSDKPVPIPRISRLAIMTLTTLTVLFGFWPNPILWLIGS